MKGWTPEQVQTVVVAVVGAVFLGLTNLLTSLKNQQKLNDVAKKTETASRKIDEHEENAQARAAVLKEGG